MAEEHGQANARQEQPGGANAAPKKMTWPELVGSTAEGAERKIKEEIGDAIRVQVIPPNTFVTMDFNQQRVRLYVDSSGNVARTPRIG
ncbi:subtilisin inhibitor CLSI-I [Syzygium oleosum]|uniref:subtilisin inhibitor CLSI-I n=1 Tax=Syzygium oleosum TaxID=219896 RepID=UPI0011D1A647|nr:subtilisin inhibitor CLSI-I [Syzygium oleosum]